MCLSNGRGVCSDFDVGILAAGEIHTKKRGRKPKRKKKLHLGNLRRSCTACRAAHRQCLVDDGENDCKRCAELQIDCDLTAELAQKKPKVTKKAVAIASTSKSILEKAKQQHSGDAVQVTDSNDAETLAAAEHDNSDILHIDGSDQFCLSEVHEMFHWEC